MDIARLNHKLKKRFGGKAAARYENGSVILSGCLEHYADVVAAGQAAAVPNSRIHIVNDISCAQAPKLPAGEAGKRDCRLEGAAPDVLIIGAGISGCSIARELAKWKLSILVADQEADVAEGASGHNDGEVHPGIDLAKGSLKQHYVLLGNRMYDQVCRELDVPFRRCGQYVGFTQGWLRPLMWLYILRRKLIDGVPGTRLISRKELRRREPELNPAFRFAMYSPTAGVVSPYGLTIAYAENAAANGAVFSLDTRVTGMEVSGGRIRSVATDRGTVYPRLVINAAGTGAERIAEMAGDRFFSIHPRKGTDVILDKKAARLLDAVAAAKAVGRPGRPAHSKGGGVMRTIDGNLLVGPTAVECPAPADTATDAEAIAEVLRKQRETLPKLDARDIIAYFTGVRAATYEEDFIIEPGRNTANLIEVAGIQSPGLTAAPAFAKDVAALAAGQLGKEGKVPLNPSYDPIRRGIPRVREMDPEARDRLIREDPDYGVIVCRCEEISKGEIRAALRNPLGVRTTDAVKKRVRPGMGRCQGGFCLPSVMRIIAEEAQEPLEGVRKDAPGSVITYGKTKQPGKGN